MTADDFGLATLGLLALLAVAIVVRQIVRCGSISVWVLSRLVRLSAILMNSQRLHGPAPLPVGEAALVIVNHRSPVDPPLVYSASIMKAGGHEMRPIEFLTAIEYCTVGGPIGWITRTARSIPVNRDGQDMGPAKEALRRLQAGHLVGIFPEGRLNFGEELLPFNRGVAWLALRGQKPVYPVFLHNSPQAEGMVKPFLKRQRVDVVFGPPIDLSRWQGMKPTAEVLEEVAAHLRAALEATGRRPLPGHVAGSPRRRPRPKCATPARGCGCSASGPATAPAAPSFRCHAPEGQSIPSESCRP